ncbi:MAG: CBS domain-containing protein [Candidatus Bathyarchaeota archaeon]|nr:CBS domain-containing protein [Candidatus Bathyarchaeota archaeon]MDH5787670.1 CBS domain-containing protein [Candidatus Bathyarchaeota archaeon]
MSQKLKKIMVENVIIIEPNNTVKKAAELMNLHEISSLIVVNSGNPVGILTERDMLKRVINEAREPEETKVVEVMSKPVIMATPNMRAGDAAKLMLKRNIKKLPVIEKRRLVGLVSLTDLLRSEGVIEFLNKHSLDGTTSRIKKVVDLYFDSLQRHRRRCPLIMKDGFSMGCQDNKCMWWVGDECAVTKLSRQLFAAS